MTQAAVLVSLLVVLTVGCGEAAGASAQGSADAGRQLITAKGCSGCHAISSIPEARGTVGPPLDGVGDPATRPTIAGGTLDNNTDNLAKWLSDPPAVKPGTMMPNLGLSPQERRHLVAFLQTLK